MFHLEPPDSRPAYIDPDPVILTADQLAMLSDVDVPQEDRLAALLDLRVGTQVWYVGNIENHLALVVKVIDPTVGKCILVVARADFIAPWVNAVAEYDPDGSEPGTWHFM